MNLGHLLPVGEQVGMINAKLIGNLDDRFGLHLLSNLGVAWHEEVLLGAEMWCQVVLVA